MRSCLLGLEPAYCICREFWLVYLIVCSFCDCPEENAFVLFWLLFFTTLFCKGLWENQFVMCTSFSYFQDYLLHLRNQILLLWMLWENQFVMCTSFSYFQDYLLHLRNQILLLWIHFKVHFRVARQVTKFIWQGSALRFSIWFHIRSRHNVIFFTLYR